MTTLSLLTTSSFDEEEDFTNEGIIWREWKSLLKVRAKQSKKMHKNDHNQYTGRVRICKDRNTEG